MRRVIRLKQAFRLKYLGNKMRCTSPKVCLGKAKYKERPGMIIFEKIINNLYQLKILCTMIEYFLIFFLPDTKVIQICAPKCITKEAR